ncbi:MAG: hypothetical protein AB3N16_00010 [Flavobacteriaceae bacterium]
MRLKYIPLVLATVLFSCSDETTVYNEESSEIALESNITILENSVDLDDAGVIDFYEPGEESGKNGASLEYALSLVARIAPPSYRGNNNLTATHVDLDGNYAYVSYNTVEATYAGAIDVVNVYNPNKPRVTSRLYYVNADINAIKYDNGFIYAVGGVDAETSVRATSNSFVVKIPVSNGKMNISRGLTYGFQQGHNANDIKVGDTSVWVTSGKDGVLAQYNKSDLKLVNELPYADLRSLDLAPDKMALLDTQKGIVLLDDALRIIKEIPVDTDFGAVTKKTLAFYGDTKVAVSEAGKGMGIYDHTTATLLEYVPIIIDPKNNDVNDKVTNAVAANEKLLLMANGGAGLSLIDEMDNGQRGSGVLELDGSINYVMSKDDFVFAASGKNGLQIIKLNRPDQSLASRCSSLSRYSGTRKLVVPQGTEKAYSGSYTFRSFAVNGSLLLCGTWANTNNVQINTNALFEMKGKIIVGKNRRRKNFIVEKNATVRIEGTMVVYGDLILKDGATLEFIGDTNSANIVGKVTKEGDVTITGTFNDVRNKF